MNFELNAEPILVKLLFQVARYAGFSSTTGLYEGKLGSAILLYNGARFINSQELELVANSLVDDVIDDPVPNGIDFCNGLYGIAWGLHYLKANKFIELDNDYFDDLDLVLFEDNSLTMLKYKYQYPFMGLYIQTRLSDTSNQISIHNTARKYVDQVIFHFSDYTETPDILTPFLYCVWLWHNEKILSDNVIEIICQKLSFLNKQFTKTYKSAALIQLYNKLSHNENLPFKGEFTFTDIKTIYFYKLLFNQLSLPPWNLINKSFRNLLANSTLIEELMNLCNHKNQGLIQNISGFTWSLLQYLEHTNSFLKIGKNNHNNIL